MSSIIRGRRSRHLAVGAAALLTLALVPISGAAQEGDPRVGLEPGYLPWTEAASNIELVDNDPRVAPFDAPPGNFGFVNSDLAFTGKFAIVGSFNGFQVYDISDPTNPALSSSFVCPGGQGDVSVFGDLLFMSVEEARGRIDCGVAPPGPPPAVEPARFRGVRIFDISDLSNPVQLPGVQTCRGSHTHTIVSDPDDAANIYIYNSGTAGVRSPLELAGCENAALTQAPVTTGNPTQWRIDVIKVPLAAPQTAAIVSQPRIFTDPSGAFNGLQNTLPGALHPSGTAYSPLPNTNTCHDITAYPDKGIAAGACQGNGILLDISDPVNPVRLDAVSDPNFSYWHSATINNEGTKVIFTDEWGGGTSARCRAQDRPEWGADAIFDIAPDGRMEFASYYKMPAVQTVNENCVAHNSSLLPVPNRDILVQAWYQGGVSVIDFTDSANPTEIAFFDRGPVNSPFPIPDPTNPNRINLGGLWSTYWYNGQVYGSEIARGFDTFGFLPSDMLSANEIDAASEVLLDQFNAQHQTMLVNAPSWAVVGANFDQAVRNGDLDERTAMQIGNRIEGAMHLDDAGANSRAIQARLESAARMVPDSAEYLQRALEEFAATLG